MSSFQSETKLVLGERKWRQDDSLFPAAIPIRLLAPVRPAEDKIEVAFPLIETFPHLTSVPEWAEAINREITSQTMDEIQFCCFLHAGRLSLKFGGWTELFRSGRLSFSKSTGEKRSLIGEVCGPLAQAPEHLRKWPVAFEALHQISRLGPDLVLQFLHDGTIHAGLTPAKARELVKIYRPELTRPPRRVNVAAIWANMRAETQAIIGHATDMELETTVTEFLEMADLVLAEVARRKGAPKEPRNGDHSRDGKSNVNGNVNLETRN